MKTLVLYKSKTGFTKKYADILREELDCDILENEKVKLNEIIDYDTIVCAGGLYAGSINGTGVIKKYFSDIKDKNLIIIAVGSNPGREEEQHVLWEHNFTEEQRKVIKTFYCRGGFDYNKLGKTDKLLMNMLKKKLEKEKNPTEDQKGLLGAYDNPEDHVSKENIMPVIDLIRGYI